MANRKSPAHFAEQAEKVYELSLAGYSQRAIAKEMGIALLTVQKRLALYIETRVHPKADEWRNKQLDRAQIYIRSLWSQVLAGDPKAIAAAVRTEERIAKLLGLDSAQLFKVEANVSRESDANEAQRLLDHYFSRDTAQTEPQVIPHVDVTQRKRRPTQERPPIQYAPATDEFAKDSTFAPHEVRPEAVQFAEDLEEFEPAPKQRTQPRIQKRSNPLLRDYDD